MSQALLSIEGVSVNMPTPRGPLTAVDVVDLTLAEGRTLGIVGESLAQEDQLAEFFGVQEVVLVRSVKKGSAAEKAGIKAGDVITKVDDSKVGSSAEITHVLRGLKSASSSSSGSYSVS